MPAAPTRSLISLGACDARQKASASGPPPKTPPFALRVAGDETMRIRQSRSASMRCLRWRNHAPARRTSAPGASFVRRAPLRQCDASASQTVAVWVATSPSDATRDLGVRPATAISGEMPQQPSPSEIEPRRRVADPPPPIDHYPPTQLVRKLGKRIAPWNGKLDGLRCRPSDTNRRRMHPPATRATRPPPNAALVCHAEAPLFRDPRDQQKNYRYSPVARVKHSVH